jgi:hypothetical protein
VWAQLLQQLAHLAERASHCFFCKRAASALLGGSTKMSSKRQKIKKKRKFASGQEAMVKKGATGTVKELSEELQVPESVRRDALVRTQTEERRGFSGEPLRRTRKELSPEWKHNLYAYHNQSALKFSSEGKLASFIEWLWANPEFRDLPRAPVGDNTIIVPAEAVQLLKKVYGSKFSDSPVVPAEAAVPRKVKTKHTTSSFQYD